MKNIQITLPDGKKINVKKGTTGYEIAKSISNSLAKESVATKIDGELHDISFPINQNSKLEIIKRNDEDALEKGLINNKVAGAWLDTFQQEPYDGNLSKFENVILTSHIGSYTYEGRRKMEIDTVNNLIKGLDVNV